MKFCATQIDEMLCYALSLQWTKGNKRAIGGFSTIDRAVATKNVFPPQLKTQVLVKRRNRTERQLRGVPRRWRCPAGTSTRAQNRMRREIVLPLASPLIVDV
jgi:hypothetical protein